MVYDPPHPGESILDLCLEPSGMSISAAADHPRSAACTCRPSSTDGPRFSRKWRSIWRKPLAVPEMWLRVQVSHDLWRAFQKATSIDGNPVPPNHARCTLRDLSTLLR